jgi:hypothetical protein
MPFDVGVVEADNSSNPSMNIRFTYTCREYDFCPVHHPNPAWKKSYRVSYFQEKYIYELPTNGIYLVSRVFNIHH